MHPVKDSVRMHLVYELICITNFLNNFIEESHSALDWENYNEQLRDWRLSA